MSREIKFRAWDKKRKHYAKVIQTTNQGWKGYRDKTYVTNGVMLFSKWVLSRFIIEQYTGLKDENGKEIYEGDIVQIPGEGALIVFDGTKGSFMGHFFMGHKGRRIEYNDCIFAFCPDDIKVIGNIHENGELLK